MFDECTKIARYRVELCVIRIQYDSLQPKRDGADPNVLHLGFLCSLASV